MNQKSSSKIYNFYFWGALGQAVHQAVSKKRLKSPKLDIPFEMDVGRLAPVSEVAGGHTIPF
jgi:hypothetical protein